MSATIRHKADPAITTGPVRRAAPSGPCGSSNFVELPTPRSDFGVSLAKALWTRRTLREFDTARELPPQVLSELLWCAYGINRSATAHRTAPSWNDARKTEITAVMNGSIWRYDPTAHRLLQHQGHESWLEATIENFVGTAPLHQVYISDGNQTDGSSLQEQYRVASAEAGFIGQNVYLYCASEGLATVFRSSFDARLLARALGLRATAFLTFVQSVGYPKL